MESMRLMVDYFQLYSNPFFSGLGTNRMKKYSQLESSSRLGQIESRLALHPYLSRGNLPSSCDAEVFLFMEELRKIPSKLSHPNTYHWFILMKQFSKRTLQVWQQERHHDQTDRLAAEFIEQGTQMLKENRPAPLNRPQFTDKNSREPTTPRLTTPKSTSKKSIIFPCIETTDNNSLPNDPPPRQPPTLKLPLSELPSRTDLPSPVLEVEYVMELQLKDCRKSTKTALYTRLLEEKVEMLQIDNDEEGPIMRITIKTEKEEWDRLKDRISKWQEISNLQFRKEKKGGQGFRTEPKSERALISPREAAH